MTGMKRQTPLHHYDSSPFFARPSNETLWCATNRCRSRQTLVGIQDPVRTFRGRFASNRPRLRTTTTTTSSRGEREKKRDSTVSRVAFRGSYNPFRRASNRWPTVVPPFAREIDSPDSAPAQLHPVAHPIVSTGGDTTTSDGRPYPRSTLLVAISRDTFFKS